LQLGQLLGGGRKRGGGFGHGRFSTPSARIVQSLR
jgi:hypothetical protein